MGILLITKRELSRFVKAFSDDAFEGILCVMFGTAKLILCTDEVLQTTGAENYQPSKNVRAPRVIKTDPPKTPAK
jgi:hypothetical protein